MYSGVWNLIEVGLNEVAAGFARGLWELYFCVLANVVAWRGVERRLVVFEVRRGAPSALEKAGGAVTVLRELQPLLKTSAVTITGKTLAESDGIATGYKVLSQAERSLSITSRSSRSGGSPWRRSSSWNWRRENALPSCFR